MIRGSGYQFQGVKRHAPISMCVCGGFLNFYNKGEAI